MKLEAVNQTLGRASGIEAYLSERARPKRDVFPEAEKLFKKPMEVLMGLGQTLFPLSMEIIESKVKHTVFSDFADRHPSLGAAAAFLLDSGVNMGAAWLILNGGVAPGVAAKAVYNISAGALTGLEKPSSNK